MSFARRPLALACVAVTTLTMAACGGSHHHASTPAPTPTTPAPTPSTSTPVALPLVNPLTGLKPSAGPVVAVKIDDTGNGRPQVNINLADIVYIEQVEGGLTRLLAIFNTHLPTVEPVRSTRASDPELMAQYGPVAYVASGGAPNPLQVLDHSNLKSDINDRGGPGFARDSSRGAPYNLTANLSVVGAALKGAQAKDIGLVWAATTDLSQDKPVGAIRTVVGGTPVTFVWNTGVRQWVRYIDGGAQATASGHLIATPNVIVQFCRVTPYPADVDVDGNPSAFTQTVGTGSASIFRNEHRIDASWSRPTATSGTTFKDKFGHVIPLAPGGVWIVLVANGASLAS